MPVIAGTSAAGCLCVSRSPPKGRIRINIYNQIIRHLPLISSHTHAHVHFVRASETNESRLADV